MYKVARLRNKANPIISVIPVTSALEASAGSWRKYFNVKGIMVPNNPAINRFPNVAIPIINPRAVLPLQKYTNIAQLIPTASPLREPITNSLPKAFHTCRNVNCFRAKALTIMARD